MFERQDQDGQFSDRATVCGAIVDYVDLDETFYNCDPFGNAPPNETGEDNYYQQIGLPYVRKNAALDSFDELHARPRPRGRRLPKCSRAREHTNRHGRATRRRRGCCARRPQSEQRRPQRDQSTDPEQHVGLHAH